MLDQNKRCGKQKWYSFDAAKGYRQKRPPINKYVLVVVKSIDECIPNPIAIGYRKDGGGDPSSPYFVIPGIGGTVLAWCDCLPDSFAWPYTERAER